jgi:hypothetical protein
MKAWTAILAVITCTVALSATQPGDDDRRALRAHIEERYDVVPLSDGIALRPKTRARDVRLIEIANGTIAINGVPVSGRELRDRTGGDADSILRVSYLSAADQQALFSAPPTTTEPGEARPERAPAAEREPTAERQPRGERPATPAPPSPPEPDFSRHRSNGDRVRIFGNVTVPEGDAVGGQVVAVLGSVRIDGEVGDQVVAVLGSVDLGPKAIVRGDVVAVGGRVRRASGSQVRGAVTEVSLNNPEIAGVSVPWVRDWTPPYLFGNLGAIPRLIGSVFRLLLLVLLASIAWLLARATVQASAQRVSDNPLKATLIGLAAQILFVPVLALSAVILAVSIVGIPLLLLLPFVLLLLLLMALVGFTGSAYAIGHWARRQFGHGGPAELLDLWVGVFVILLPLLVGRVVAIAGWPISGIAVALIAGGIGLEFLAWTCGFGAVLSNTFSRWQARRSTRTTPIG